MNGELVGFVANDILGEKAWLKENSGRDPVDYRKVLYPSGFAAAKCLFGFDEVPQNVDVLVITEGSREVMKLVQEGYFAVAVLRAGISKDQVKLLAEKQPRYVALMFDGDKAGYSAMEKVLNELRGIFRVIPVEIPDGVDPKQLERKDFDCLIKSSEIVLE